jgi:hypothetical protein
MKWDGRALTLPVFTARGGGGRDAARDEPRVVAGLAAVARRGCCNVGCTEAKACWSCCGLEVSSSRSADAPLGGDCDVDVDSLTFTRAASRASGAPYGCPRIAYSLHLPPSLYWKLHPLRQDAAIFSIDTSPSGRSCVVRDFIRGAGTPQRRGHHARRHVPRINSYLFIHFVDPGGDWRRAGRARIFDDVVVVVVEVIVRVVVPRARCAQVARRVLVVGRERRSLEAPSRCEQRAGRRGAGRG